MKANELRIGNYVTIAHESNTPLIKVETITEHFINVFDNRIGYDIRFVLPIPITEEWLLKFGFKKSWGRNDVWIDRSKTIEVYNYDGVQEYDDGTKRVEGIKEGEYAICADDGYIAISKPFKYVHQLQNIIFALTGEELKIDE